MSEHRYYYRCHNRELVKAVKDHFAARQKVTEEGVKFARKFGGAAAMFGSAVHMFIGVSFKRDKPPKQPELWTQPDKHGMRTPKKGTELRRQWDKQKPKGQVHELHADWHDLIGYSWYPGRGLGYAVVGSHVYFASVGGELTGKNMVEIKTSDYVKAVGQKEKA